MILGQSHVCHARLENPAMIGNGPNDGRDASTLDVADQSGTDPTNQPHPDVRHIFRFDAGVAVAETFVPPRPGIGRQPEAYGCRLMFRDPPILHPYRQGLKNDRGGCRVQSPLVVIGIPGRRVAPFRRFHGIGLSASPRAPQPRRRHQFRHFRGIEAQHVAQDLGGVLAEQRGARHLGGAVRQLDRVAN